MLLILLFFLVISTTFAAENKKTTTIGPPVASSDHLSYLAGLVFKDKLIGHGVVLTSHWILTSGKITEVSEARIGNSKWSQGSRYPIDRVETSSKNNPFLTLLRTKQEILPTPAIPFWNTIAVDVQLDGLAAGWDNPNGQVDDSQGHYNLTLTPPFENCGIKNPLENAENTFCAIGTNKTKINFHEVGRGIPFVYEGVLIGIFNYAITANPNRMVNVFTRIMDFEFWIEWMTRLG